MGNYIRIWTALSQNLFFPWNRFFSRYYIDGIILHNLSKSEHPKSVEMQFVNIKHIKVLRSVFLLY